jgi:hypothetical protein
MNSIGNILTWATNKWRERERERETLATSSKVRIAFITIGAIAQVTWAVDRVHTDTVITDAHI